VIKKNSPQRIPGKQTTKCHRWNEERQVGSELPVIPAHTGTRRAQRPPGPTGHLSAASSEPLAEKHQTNVEHAGIFNAVLLHFKFDLIRRGKYI